jgi:hypothetical protein
MPYNISKLVFTRKRLSEVQELSSDPLNFSAFYDFGCFLTIPYYHFDIRVLKKHDFRGAL